MKFSAAAAVTAFVMANGVTAMPWSSKHHDGGNDITLHIKVDGGRGVAAGQSHSSQQVITNAFNTGEICWLLCATSDITCPEGWYSKEFGECWTCCRE